MVGVDLYHVGILIILEILGVVAVKTKVSSISFMDVKPLLRCQVHVG